MNLIKENLNAAREHALDFLRWILLAVITGFVVGGVGILFVKGLGLANGFRGSHPEIILGLPLAGLFLVFLYKICHYENDKGTNLVISTLHAETQIPFRMAPLIFIATITTHLFGGSAGREGAALQLGGSIGNQLGRCFHLDEDDTRLIWYECRIFCHFRDTACSRYLCNGSGNHRRYAVRSICSVYVCFLNRFFLCNRHGLSRRSIYHYGTA